jgi:hypothetical protein
MFPWETSGCLPKALQIYFLVLLFLHRPLSTWSPRCLTQPPRWGLTSLHCAVSTPPITGVFSPLRTYLYSCPDAFN